VEILTDAWSGGRVLDLVLESLGKVLDFFVSKRVEILTDAWSGGRVLDLKLRDVHPVHYKQP